jgi:hypothetical protein
LLKLPAAKQAEEFNIMEVFDVTPEGEPHGGQFRNDDHVFNLYSHSTVIIMYTAYLIMKQASPRLTPHIIYQLVLHPGFGTTLIEGIDYGPVKGIHLELYANWSRISDVSYDYDEEQLDYWHRMLTQKGKTDEEILHDAWRGPGNMWVFVRPDRFVLVTFTSAHPPTLALQVPYCRDTGGKTVVGDFGIHRCRDDDARRSPS